MGDRAFCNFLLRKSLGPRALGPVVKESWQSEMSQLAVFSAINACEHYPPGQPIILQVSPENSLANSEANISGN